MSFGLGTLADFGRWSTSGLENSGRVVHSLTSRAKSVSCACCAHAEAARASAIRIFVMRLLRVRRLGAHVSIQEPVEPIELPVQTLHQMFRLAGACQVMILARENHQLRRNAVMLERPE